MFLTANLVTVVDLLQTVPVIPIGVVGDGLGITPNHQVGSSFGELEGVLFFSEGVNNIPHLKLKVNRVIFIVITCPLKTRICLLINM